jgi:chromate transporter
MKKALKLFFVFLKIGAFTFGGGYAMIPLIHKEIVEKYGWITDEEMLDMLAIAESTPGVIAVNSSTFVGYRVGGMLGATLATLGVVLPSLIIISVISIFLVEFKSLSYVKYAFEGIRAGAIVLIFNASLQMAKISKKSAFNILIMGGSFVVASLTNISVILLLFSGVVIGLVADIFLKKDRLVKK